MYICLCVHIYIFFIGRGGYGHVMLCKNKLDGRQYAVKKIRLKEKSLRDRMLRSASAVETDRRRKCLTSIIIPSPINFFTQKCLFASQTVLVLFVPWSIMLHTRLKVVISEFNFHK